MRVALAISAVLLVGGLTAMQINQQQDNISDIRYCFHCGCASTPRPFHQGNISRMILKLNGEPMARVLSCVDEERYPDHGYWLEWFSKDDPYIPHAPSYHLWEPLEHREKENFYDPWNKGQGDDHGSP